jgi:hypothetical protein
MPLAGLFFLNKLDRRCGKVGGKRGAGPDSPKPLDGRETVFRDFDQFFSSSSSLTSPRVDGLARPIDESIRMSGI